jgi:hypothetical protein
LGGDSKALSVGLLQSLSDICLVQHTERLDQLRAASRSADAKTVERQLA